MTHKGLRPFAWKGRGDNCQENKGWGKCTKLWKHWSGFWQTCWAEVTGHSQSLMESLFCATRSSLDTHCGPCIVRGVRNATGNMPFVPPRTSQAVGTSLEGCPNPDLFPTGWGDTSKGRHSSCRHFRLQLLLSLQSHLTHPLFNLIGQSTRHKSLKPSQEVIIEPSLGLFSIIVKIPRVPSWGKNGKERIPRADLARTQS